MDKTKISDLEVFYCVGVPDEERAQPQRLLLTVEMVSDFAPAALSDRLTKTIDYYAVTQFLLKFGEERNWRLLEKLVTNLADELLAKFKPQSVTVEVKKFIIPQAQYVSVTLMRPRRR
jgi:FolB domain-containing protein